MQINQYSRLSVAPMMDWTDRHCRYFHRLLAPKALLYTEMVTTGALIHGPAKRHLDFDGLERPLALQLGGSSPVDLQKAVQIAADYPYDEINLNVGCPSERVQNGAFGACLMAEPELVRDCCAAMIDASSLPITIKTRIGIDDSEDYVFLKYFVETVATAGVDVFIIHARKAWLKGLSPKQNRMIPPLCYDHVYRLKEERPDLTIIINGGIVDPQQAAAMVEKCDGVMVGRQAYHEPASLPAFEKALFGQAIALEPHEVIELLSGYIDQQMAKGTPFRSIARHTLGLFNGRPGARRYRRVLSEGMGLADAGPWLFKEAMAGLAPALQD